MKRFFTLILTLSLLSSSLVTNLEVNAAQNEMSIYFKEASTENSTQNYHGAKFEPKVGAYLGMFAEGDEVVHNVWTGSPFYFDGVPSLTGKKHAMYMIYIHYSDMEFNHYIKHYGLAKDNNCGMQVALEPDEGLSAIVDDEKLHKFARQAKESGIPILLRFANEMNDTGSTWGKDKELYKEKFRLVASVMHAEAPNVAMCWAPNDWGYKGFEDAHEWYPGDEYVDWVGISSYPPYNPDGESKHKTKWTDRLAKVYNAYADRKPIYLAEGAPIQNVEFEDTASMSKVAAKDLKEFYDEVARRYPAIKAIFYWDNEETWGAKRKCKISNNPTVLQAYKNAIADPFFLSEMNTNSPVIYKDLANLKDMGLKSKVYEFSAFVGNHSLKANKVVYYLNDKFINEIVGSPYTCNIDLSGYAGENVRIKADSYDVNNKLIKSITYNLNVSLDGPMNKEMAYKMFDKITEEPIKIEKFSKDVKLMITDKASGEGMDITGKLSDGLRVVNDRSAVGLRDLANVVDGVEVKWIGDHRCVVLKTAEKELVYPLNKAKMFNGTEMISLDTKATVDPEISKSFLPIRSIAEALGYEVIWHEDTATIELSK